MGGYSLSYLSKTDITKTQLSIIEIISEIFTAAEIKMNPLQLRILTETIIREYPALKLSDIVLIIKKGVAGLFGKLSWGEFHFSEVTGADGWIKQYSLWKAIHEEKREQEQKIEYKRTHEAIMKEMNESIKKQKELRERAKKRIEEKDIPDLETLKSKWREEIKGIDFPEEEYIKSKIKQLLYQMNK